MTIDDVPTFSPATRLYLVGSPVELADADGTPTAGLDMGDGTVRTMDPALLPLMEFLGASRTIEEVLTHLTSNGAPESLLQELLFEGVCIPLDGDEPTFAEVIWVDVLADVFQDPSDRDVVYVKDPRQDDIYAAFPAEIFAVLGATSTRASLKDAVGAAASTFGVTAPDIYASVRANLPELCALGAVRILVLGDE